MRPAKREDMTTEGVFFFLFYFLLLLLFLFLFFFAIIVRGRSLGRRGSSAAICESLSFPTSNAESHPPASGPMGVERLCGLSGSSKSDGGTLDVHKSNLVSHPHAQSVHDIAQNRHGLSGRQGAGQGWPWGGRVHGDVCLVQWPDPCTAGVHSRPNRTQSAARDSSLGSYLPRQVL